MAQFLSCYVQSVYVAHKKLAFISIPIIDILPLYQCKACTTDTAATSTDYITLARVG